MTFFRLAVIIGALPVTLTNGTTADATQVMSDLNFIVNQVNANAAPLATTALTNANNNFTTVQSGQAATQPANFPIASQIQNASLTGLSSTLGTNTITARIATLALGGYVSGQVFTFFPSQPNGGATTLNIDGLGAKSILNMGSSLSGAELQTYKPAIVAFDGTLNALDLLNGPPYVQGPNIPSATTLNLDAQFGDYNQVDNTVNITAMTLSRGRQKLLEFTSSPLLSHSASLILGSNITPNPGDVFLFRGEASSVVRLAAQFLVNKPTKKRTRTVKLSGSGLYVPPVGCTYYDVQLIGGGGGGGAANTNNGQIGGATTFGPMTGNPGVGANHGANGGNGGAGGPATGGDINLTGGAGGGGITGALTNLIGGMGGQGFFGGGSSSNDGAAGVAAASNTGAGGGGGASASTSSGGGGGAGGYSRKLFVPAVPNSFSIGASGAGGAAGIIPGGAGGSGIIIIEEFYD